MTATDTVGPAPTGRPQKKRSFVQLLADIPAIVRELVAGEIALLKQEMIAKLKALGIGAALLVVALIFVFATLGVLLTAAVLALSLVLPGWLSALIIAAFLLIVAVIFGLVGYRVLKRGIPPIPKQTISGLKKDLNVIKGVGKRPTGERE